MKKLRKPPANKEMLGRFISERPRIIRGKFTAMITVYGKGKNLRITLLSTSRGDGIAETRYYARLIGNSFIVHDESPEAKYMPPYYGRTFATRRELEELMSEMLAAFIMLHA